MPPRALSEPGTPAQPGETDRVRLGVLGWPVAHSLSPQMQGAALRELGLTHWSYERLPVPSSLFVETTLALPALGFRGVNVTIPHKAAALELADSRSEAAAAIGAANTLTFTAAGRIVAANTDAPGLIAALSFSPRGMRALVLGAGGSARAAVWALREAGAADIVVVNRTPERAASLAQELGVCAATRPQSADLLVNCTAVGLLSGADQLSELGLDEPRLASYPNVVDLVYAPGGTGLIESARRGGARTVDGLEVLLAQGALSLELWTGRAAPLDAMRAALGR